MSWFPDWLLACMTGLGICALVLGWWRAATILAAPAVSKFIVWPLLWHFAQSLPLVLLILLALIALPFLILRLLRRLLSLATSENAADHALGHFLGHSMTSISQANHRRRRRRRPCLKRDAGKL